ncbi:repressor LexA [Peptoniphilus asaccharolyticus DSM 20463]|uniref:LexA repressor n=1 Tax=Peptoniphilus asaccharolyticus DSM 20463 TaxID=573058 RepID=A0A1W1US00_PEPAS|nr:transcriptional repressor LexA [Peptoniphilus asaccharolyticus]MBL7575085.1 transcriptional repressor LexA [Peptoniphilus asaccharolyticus]SMB83601.1 repressor LexA [Peptoniphilus asaccharolyticus DSM 20463]
MYEDLNQRERDVLFYLIQQIQLKGYPPTVREICQQLNIKSTSTVHGSLEKLEIKGYIKKDPTKPRAIEILNNSEDVFLNKKKTVDIPIVGQVSAGAPILAFENIEDTYPLPIEFAQDRNLFILKIVGESMINAGILDGDFVIIEKRDFAKNGDKVLALIGEDSTVKTFYKEKDGFRLQPENDFMEPIYVKDLKILGVVVGLYRKM